MISFSDIKNTSELGLAGLVVKKQNTKHDKQYTGVFL